MSAPVIVVTFADDYHEVFEGRCYDRSESAYALIKDAIPSADDLTKEFRAALPLTIELVPAGPARIFGAAAGPDPPEARSRIVVAHRVWGGAGGPGSAEVNVRTNTQRAVERYERIRDLGSCPPAWKFRAREKWLRAFAAIMAVDITEMDDMLRGIYTDEYLQGMATQRGPTLAMLDCGIVPIEDGVSEDIEHDRYEEADRRAKAKVRAAKKP